MVSTFAYLKISISKNRMKQNDENLSELGLKSFWYKFPKWIWLYLSQFSTVFDEPKIKLKVINVITRLHNACDRLTSCNLFQPVFEWFWMIFEMRRPAIGITPNLRALPSPTYSHGSPMDSNGFRQTPMGLFFGMGLSIVCLSYWTFFPQVLSKTHQTPLESCIGLRCV